MPSQSESRYGTVLIWHASLLDNTANNSAAKEDFTLCLSLAHSHCLSLSRSLCPSLSLPHSFASPSSPLPSLPLPLSLSLSLTHSHCLTLSHTVSVSLSL